MATTISRTGVSTAATAHSTASASSSTARSGASSSTAVGVSSPSAATALLSSTSAAVSTASPTTAVSAVSTASSNARPSIITSTTSSNTEIITVSTISGNSPQAIPNAASSSSSGGSTLSKGAIAAIGAVGGLAVLIAIWRLYAFFATSAQRRRAKKHSPDPLDFQPPSTSGMREKMSRSRASRNPLLSPFGGTAGKDSMSRHGSSQLGMIADSHNDIGGVTFDSRAESSLSSSGTALEPLQTTSHSIIGTDALRDAARWSPRYTMHFAGHGGFGQAHGQGGSTGVLRDTAMLSPAREFGQLRPGQRPYSYAEGDHQQYPSHSMSPLASPAPPMANRRPQAALSMYGAAAARRPLSSSFSYSLHRRSGAPHGPHSRVEIMVPSPLGALVAMDQTTMQFSSLSGIGSPGNEQVALDVAEGRGKEWRELTRKEGSSGNEGGPFRYPGPFQSHHVADSSTSFPSGSDGDRGVYSRTNRGDLRRWPLQGNERQVGGAFPGGADSTGKADAEGVGPSVQGGFLDGGGEETQNGRELSRPRQGRDAEKEDGAIRNGGMAVPVGSAKSSLEALGRHLKWETQREATSNALGTSAEEGSGTGDGSAEYEMKGEVGRGTKP